MTETSSAMSGGSHFVWTPLLLFCIFQPSDNRYVHHDETTFIRRTGNPEVDDILSKIPITLPEGIDPKNVNVTSITVRTCTGMKEHLALLNTQLQQTRLRNSQLDEEAFGLRRDVRLLNLQLATCSSTASAITDSYQIQLHNKMQELLNKLDSDTSLMLTISTLTREVNTLERRIKLAANSSETATDLTALQSELQQKMTELTAKQQQIAKSHTNSALILQIISLQNQIWDLQQEESRRGETSLQHEQRIKALQEQLDGKISELQRREDASSAMLHLISVNNKIAVIERYISVYTGRSRTDGSDYQRQLKQKGDLLKKKIMLLNRDEKNSNLTREILILQAEMDHFRQLISNAQGITTSRLTELRAMLEEAKKQQANLEKQLEETDYIQAQRIINIITIMKEIRHLQGDKQQQTTPTSPASSLEALLKDKERQYAKAQADIKELERRLQVNNEECSGLEKQYTQVKTELEQKIADLSNGDSKASLILNVVNLYDELKTLKYLISITQDPQSVTELQRQLEKKQAELNSKKAEIQKQIGNPKIVLTVIELQNEIWDLQNKGTNGTTSNRLKELQARVDGLISEIDDRGDENTNLMLRIMTLQNQVNQLQKQLSDLQVSQTAQVNQLKTDLTVKKKELQDYVNELHEKNQTNSRLILTITNLQNQLRKLEEERRNDSNISSLTITQLRKQLMARKAVQSHDQAEIQTLKNLLQAEERAHAFAQANIRDLQRKLQLKIEECSGLEERYTHVKTELEQKIAELKRRGDSKAALILNVINLHEELRTLKNQILTTEDPETLAELRRQLEEKQTELDSENADIERQIGNPKIILTIIELQNEIWDLQNKGTNGTTSNHIKELQTRVDGLIADISDKGNENTKLMLRIMTLQSQVERLQKQLSDLRKVKTPQVTQLENDLNTKKNELQRYINELNEKNQANAELILTITNLNNQLRKVQEEKQKEGQTTSATITELREQLQIKTEEHSRDQDTIKALQNKLNQTEAQCSGYEHRITELQSDLDEKMKRLQSESDSVTTLALQVSTLTLQLEELKKQLENTDSKNKIRELQMQIDEKNKELAKKTEELNARSAQPQRLLQIITIQTEIEKFANAAVNETDYNKIRALQEQINYLVEGIQDEKTKLVYQVLTRQDEVARLKKQEESQRQALLDNIKDLENQLEEIRHEITEKTQVLDSSDMRITNLSAQIMELHKKIKPLEDEISYLKETHAENEADLQRRLDLTKRQLQDSELRLKEADTKNFNSIMEIADLRAQLKKAQKQASKADKKNINELEEQLQTQQRANRKLENTNRDLQQEVKELKKCCNDNTHCEDLQRQLQQSQEDADRLQQQLTEKEADFKQLQQDLKEQTRENERLRNENSNLKRQLSQNEDNADLQQQLQKKDSLINQLQQELDERTATNQKLQDDYNNLQNERDNLEDRVQALQNKLSDVEDKTIHARRMTLDPNTAHPRIILSADDSEMSTTEDIQNVPDNPSRFDVVLAVLGKTGFSTGRNYWEVSVAGKQCYHLGMASESAPRKGSVTFNPRKGFWTIVRNKQGEYRAVDRTPVAIKVTTQPITLGILLDYKKGQISFYDAGARSHMYTFAGQTFTDRIYPFINFCVEDGPQTPIVLVAPGTVDWIK
ncbi:putative leucine-rich repeat-containing protein DDB_G0290503 [Trachinotus anak]|uniref:putative leucine-rich repeat-containing protein DDB_G0290503 n=1 Tax=Trachinotus anak TaxID=443729 RepID=UPI0039F16A08